MAIATNFLEKSFLPVAGAALSLCTLTIAEPAQALGFTPYNAGFLSINTSGSSHTLGTNSVSVTGGTIDSSLPIGGAGYLFQATASGTVTFNWDFDPSNDQALFGYAIFDDENELNTALSYLPLLSVSFSTNFPTVRDIVDPQPLAYGVTGSGQKSFDVVAGNIFGFGVAALLSSDVVDNPNLGNFTISNLQFEPDAVPTPAAVLPVLGGLLAAARQKKNQVDSDLEQN